MYLMDGSILCYLEFTAELYLMEHEGALFLGDCVQFSSFTLRCDTICFLS